MKKCKQCGLELDESSFFKHKSYKDGYRQPCKNCLKKNQSEKEVSIKKDGTKVCSSCNEEKSILDFNINKTNKDGRTYKCKFCIASNRRENPKQSLLCSAKERAKQNGLEFTLTEDDIKIPSICPVLGIKIQKSEYCAGRHDNRTDNSPSIDRIDNSKGYTPENIIIVSWRANRLKGDGDFSDFQKIKDFLFNKKLFIDLSGPDAEHLEIVLNHIKGVQDNCKKLSSRLLKIESDREYNNHISIKLLARGYCHDNSKFKGVEWLYLRDAVKINHPELFNIALYQHVTTNDHHPEFWPGGIQFMTDDAIAEMVCDWKSRSDEMGTSLKDWIKESATQKFNFTINDKIYKKISFYVDRLLDPIF